MFNLPTPSYLFNASSSLLTRFLGGATASPKSASAEHDPYAPPISAQTQAEEALPTVANFAVTTTSSLLNLAWTGLVNYGPPVAKGIWNGVSTYGPQVAKGVWNGVSTYGPPIAKGVWDGVVTYGPPVAKGIAAGIQNYGPQVASALGKATVFAASNTWEAAKWGGGALSKMAEDYQAKEHASYAGQKMLDGTLKGVAALSEMAGIPNYGPQAASALGKATVFAASNSWEAAKWAGGALSEMAEDYQAKEHASYAGQQMLDGTLKGLAALSEKAGTLMGMEQSAVSPALGDDDQPALVVGEEAPSVAATPESAAQDGAVNEVLPTTQMTISVVLMESAKSEAFSQKAQSSDHFATLSAIEQQVLLDCGEGDHESGLQDAQHSSLPDALMLAGIALTVSVALTGMVTDHGANSPAHAYAA